MDFARKQLEKYGWTAGKGLGKNENGISEALKPKLKRSVTGVGHDLASDFTEHWWNDLYNKAAKNVEVEEVNGKVKKIKSKEATFEITNNTWQIKKKRKGESSEEQYTDYFVKTAILSNGASKMENINTSESEDEGLAKDILKITDEELFSACEGRTAHKGARHGLKALGKLARIEQQEQLLLNQEKYNGYSNKSKHNVKIEIENNNSQDKSPNLCDTDQVVIKKKIKKQVYEASENFATDYFDQLNENSESRIPEVHKKKKHKRKNNIDFSIENNISKGVANDSLNNKKKTTVGVSSIPCEIQTLDIQGNTEDVTSDLKKKKRDKRRHDTGYSAESNINTEIDKINSKKKKIKHVECTANETNEGNVIEVQKNFDNILIKKHKKKRKNVKS